MHLNFIEVTILSYSIFIAGVIGIFRFDQIRDIYRPFIYLIWIGCVTEVTNTYFAYVYHNNIAVRIIYVLCESLLLLWFFSRLGLFKKHNNIFYALILAFVGIWLADNFFSSHFNLKITFYFDIIYALVLVILSITAINNLLFTEKELLKNPTFLICIGLIIFFTYQVMQRMFGLYGLRETADFRRSVQTIMVLINFLTNLIYAFAVLRMRKRRPFTFQF